MSHLILVRHGQSEWNLEKKFTGWVDVELAPNGKLEACKSGELIKELNLNLDYFFCSYQKRAIETLNLILNTLRIKNNDTIKAWELNERHYGALTGLNKDEMKKTLGEDKVLEFRRSWDIRPEPLNKNNPYHPINIEIYKNIPQLLEHLLVFELLHPVELAHYLHHRVYELQSMSLIFFFRKSLIYILAGKYLFRKCFENSKHLILNIYLETRTFTH